MGLRNSELTPRKPPNRYTYIKDLFSAQTTNRKIKVCKIALFQLFLSHDKVLLLCFIKWA